MDREQLDRLKKDIKYLGFGETNTILYTELEDQIENGPVDFHLQTEAFFDDDTRIEAKLYFELSKDSTRYIFKRYVATLHYSNQPEKTRTQTIYIYRGKGFTFKETFNLLEGRAVNRNHTDFEGSEYNAWTELNFNEKDKHGNYRTREYREPFRYDLEKALEIYRIAELKNDTLRTEVIRSLQRGNIHPVKLLKGSKWEKVFIEANPSNRLITIRSLATKAVVDYKKDPEGEIPATKIPDTANGSKPEEGQEFMPSELGIIGVPTETEELEEEELQPAEGQLQPVEGRPQPATTRSSHRKRIYK